VIYLVQILFIVYACFSATEEAAWSWGYRNIMMPSDQRDRQQDKAHDFGASAVGVVIVMASMPFLWFLFPNVGDMILYFVSSALLSVLWYWLLFDIVYAKSIGKNWDYIGETASTDNRLVEWFGKNAGEIKAVACVVLILIINILLIVL